MFIWTCRFVMETLVPLCSITTGSLESWHREKASHQNLVLYLYKSGSAEDPSRPRCAQCVAIPTTEMHPGEVNQMHRLAWEATVSPALSSRQSSAWPPSACIALPRFLSQGLVPAHPPSLPIFTATAELLRSAQTSLGIREGICKQWGSTAPFLWWNLCREEFLWPSVLWCSGWRRAISAPLQLEQNSAEAAREKSGQLFKQFNNEHLVNDCEDIISNLCQKRGPSVLKVCHVLTNWSRLVAEVMPWSDSGISFHLLSQQLRSRAEMPFSPHSFAWFTSSCGHTRLNPCNGFGLKRGKKRQGSVFL